MAWNAFSETKILMRGGLNPPYILFLQRCLRPWFKPLAFIAPPPPFVKKHSGSSPFCTYISMYLVYGDVLWRIQPLIYIYSCDTGYSKGNPGRFAPDPVRPLDVSPQRRFAPGRFAPGRFAPLVVSPLVDSPQEENSTYFVEIYVNS